MPYTNPTAWVGEAKPKPTTFRVSDTAVIVALESQVGQATFYTEDTAVVQSGEEAKQPAAKESIMLELFVGQVKLRLLVPQER